jgi:hypothetical protein
MAYTVIVAVGPEDHDGTREEGGVLTAAETDVPAKKLYPARRRIT